jgi:hypothetical protein
MPYSPPASAIDHRTRLPGRPILPRLLAVRSTLALCRWGFRLQDADAERDLRVADRELQRRAFEGDGGGRPVSMLVGCAAC